MIVIDHERASIAIKVPRSCDVRAIAMSNGIRSVGIGPLWVLNTRRDGRVVARSRRR